MDAKISVIITSFGHVNFFQSCLHALDAQETQIPFEVILVESSLDLRVKEVLKEFPSVRLIRSPKRLLAGAARNLGVKHSTSNGLAFLDIDCTPEKDWIQQAYLSIMAGNKITGGPILDAEPASPVQWADNQLQFADYRSGRPAGYDEHFPCCNLIVAHEVFDFVGGFREDIIGGDDVTFNAKAAERYKEGMVFNPLLAVRHYGRATLSAFLEHHYSYGLARARLQLRMNDFWKMMLGNRLFAPLVFIRRAGYICLRTFQYNLPEYRRFILYFPLIFIGLLWWTRGFYNMGNSQEK